MTELASVGDFCPNSDCPVYGDTEALRAIDELHNFGVAVRFASQPDLDPMDPDDRLYFNILSTGEITLAYEAHWLA